MAVKRLNEVYRRHRALWADDFSHAGFEWLEANDGDHNVLAYLRKCGATGPAGATTGSDGARNDSDGARNDSDVVAIVVNFAGTPHENYRVGLPHGGAWDEVFNSDATEYGGSGVGNLGRVRAEEVPWRGQRHSVALRVPPLGAVFLAPARD